LTKATKFFITKGMENKKLLEPGNLEKLPRDKEIVIICYVGHSAGQALVMPRLLGYNAVVLKYGMGPPSKAFRFPVGSISTSIPYPGKRRNKKKFKILLNFFFQLINIGV